MCKQTYKFFLQCKKKKVSFSSSVRREVRTYKSVKNGSEPTLTRTLDQIRIKQLQPITAVSDSDPSGVGVLTIFETVPTDQKRSESRPPGRPPDRPVTGAEERAGGGSSPPRQTAAAFAFSGSDCVDWTGPDGPEDKNTPGGAGSSFQ